MKKICPTSDIKINSVKQFNIDNTIVAIVHTKSDKFYAIDDKCSHGDIYLSEGFVENCYLECIGHGSKFNLLNGKPYNLPATRAIKVYALEIKNNYIYIDINIVINFEELKTSKESL